MSPSEKPDHRIRVAAEKRLRMRARLLECALTVFADKGVGASVIQDVIDAAEVSQGTFYNYFRTNEELLFAVTEEISNDLVGAIEQVVLAYPDAAVRIATGVRLYLYIARAFPLFARFIASTGVHLASPNNLFYTYVPPHLKAGFETGRFQPMPTEAALDVISGVALAAIARLVGGNAPDDHPEQVAAAILRALGMPRKEVEKIAFSPLEPLTIPIESLVARATERSVTQTGATPRRSRMSARK
jgi:AcrR family transcriptional regulator